MLRANLTIAAVLALTPLLILPGYFFYYDVTPKIAVALIGTAIAVLFFIGDTRFAGARRLWADSLGRAFCLMSLAQIVALLVSTLLSSHPALSWNGGNWRRMGFISQCAVIVLAFICAASSSESGLRILLRAISAAGAAVALYGILQYFGIDPFLPSASYHIGEGVTTIVRPPSTLGHADYFAGYLIYVVFLGAGLAALEVKSAWKALGAAATTVGSVAIVLNGTRGALLGLAAGAIVLCIWNRPRFTKGHQLLAAALCAIGLAFYFSPGGLKLRARTQWALEDVRGGARLWLWHDSVRMANQRWLVGFGPDTFGLEFPKYQSVELSQAYPDFYHESPHNIALDAWVSEGIPGLAILSGFLVLACFAVRRAAIRKQRPAPYLAAALLSALVSGIFVCFTMTGYLYFGTTVALLIGLVIPDSERLPEVRKSVRAFVLALGVPAIAMFLYLAVRLTASDLALEQSKRDLDAGRIKESIAAYSRSQGWHPAGSSDDLYFSRALAAASRTASNQAGVLIASQQAFLVAERAAKTSEESQNAWYNLAGFYATRNDPTDTEACLRRSVGASPNWFKPHWALAQVFLLSGRRMEAFTEAARAADLDGGKDTEITSFLQSLHQASISPKAE
jgi:O-antigen ligase